MKNIFALFSCFIVLTCGQTDEPVVEADEKIIKTLEPGDYAPNFNLKNIDGEMVSPEDYPNAKGFIVVFTCNTCPVSKKYEDRLIALGKKYNPIGYPVIAINPNPPSPLLIFSGETFKKMQKKAKTKGFTFPYLFDEGQIVTDQFGARVTPHIFLLEKEDSKYKVVYTGALDNDTWNRKPEKTLFVEDAIAALEAGEKIKVASTKAIGCEVKRSFGGLAE